VNVTFGVKTLLLLLSTITFVLAVFDEKNYANLLAWGLAGIALALLLTDIGWDRKYGGRMGSGSHNP
jgi:heme/copper-type cytochrome/quinol oxidase subunit 3